MQDLINQLKNSGEDYGIRFYYLDDNTDEFSSSNCYNLKITDNLISYSCDDVSYFIYTRNLKKITVFQTDYLY